MTAVPADLPEPILEAAAIWHARLRDAGSGADRAADGQDDIHAAFHIWLHADPRHARAFDDMQMLWGALEKPVEKLKTEQNGAMPQLRSHPSIAAPRLPFWRAALVAVLLLAAGAGLVAQGDVITRWRADYIAGIGEIAPLTLADHSRVVLNTQGAMAVRFTPAERRIRLLRGEAWFEISPADPRPFLVETPGGIVRVTGTSFNLRIADGGTVVSLVEGRVELRPADAGAGGPPVLLAPGREAVLSAAAVSPAIAFDRIAVTAWQRGQFVFYNATLSNVVATLNRYRPGHILVLDAALNDLTVSGVFSTRDPDAALEAIGKTLPVRVNRLSDHLVLLRLSSNGTQPARR